MPYSMKFENEDENKISKNEGYFFGQHPLVEKLRTGTDIYLYLKRPFEIQFQKTI